MTNLQELIETANRLSQRLENAANDELKFSIDLQIRLETMSWEMLRAANELKQINDYT